MSSTGGKSWLHKELWAARTSRKIGKLLVGVLIAGFFWVNWLNPYEREAARSALIEARKIRTVDEKDLAKETEEAERREAKVERSAWTLRDMKLRNAVSITSFLARSCRKMELLSFKMKPEVRQRITRDSGPSSATCNSQYEMLDGLVRPLVDVKSGF